MNVKAEIGLMHVQVKEHQKLPANHQTLREQPRTELAQGANSADTLISDIWPPELGDNKFGCLNHPIYGVCYGSPSKLIWVPSTWFPPVF